MSGYKVPIVDHENPFYCPTFPKAAYLEGLRRNLTVRGRYRPAPRQPLLHSESDKDMGSDWILGDYFISATGRSTSPNSPGADDLPPYSSTDSVWASRRSDPDVEMNNVTVGRGRQSRDSRLPTKRKSIDTFSDFHAPPNYARSIQSVHDSSFDVEVFHTRLCFLGEDSPPAGNLTGQTSVSLGILDIINRLDFILPGIRLGERLRALNTLTPQSVMDFLMDNDHVNERTLDVLRLSKVQRIAFLPFMFNNNGLNILGTEIYTIFSKPNSFLDLTELSFAGSRLQDFDLVHIHHLPRLSILILNETGISDEAVFLLVPLKRTLTRLSLASNSDITDEAVPALMLLSQLSFLSILHTSICMEGLRRIGVAKAWDYRIFDVEIPITCQDYLDNIKSRYSVNPQPPLITKDALCSQLSAAALQRNLEAHAACNSSILTSGSRPEMMQRLQEILKTRRLDNLVVNLLERKLTGNRK